MDSEAIRRISVLLEDIASQVRAVATAHVTLHTKLDGILAQLTKIDFKLDRLISGRPSKAESAPPGVGGVR